MARSRRIPSQNPTADSGKMPAAMHHFTDVQLRRVVRTLLERAGSEAAEAAQVADHLVEANLRGHDSHGIGMIPHYVHNLSNGTVRPNTGLAVVRDGGAVMVFDGGMGYGQRVGAEMMERLIVRARELGAVVAALRNVHHLGRIGTYAEMAVAAGLVSIHFVNVTGHPPLVAPYRGSHARFGTNPISIGVPGTARHEPFLLDMATSHIALGKVQGRAQQGRADHAGDAGGRAGPAHHRPQGHVPGRRGVARGALAARPAQGLRPALRGRAAGRRHRRRRDFASGDRGPRLHPQQHVERWSSIPASLTDSERMEREHDTIVDYVTSSPPANPEEPVLVAGDPERMTMEKRLAEGIPVDPVTWEGILDAGEFVGLPRSEATALVSNALNRPPAPASNSSEAEPRTGGPTP